MTNFAIFFFLPFTQLTDHATLAIYRGELYEFVPRFVIRLVARWVHHIRTTLVYTYITTKISCINYIQLCYTRSYDGRTLAITILHRDTKFVTRYTKLCSVQYYFETSGFFFFFFLRMTLHIPTFCSCFVTFKAKHALPYSLLSLI